MVRDIEPNLPIDEISTVTEDVSRLVAVERLIAKIGLMLALLALALATAGIYAVVACAAGERTREFGIRLALGATRRGVEGLVLRSTVRVTTAGIIVGLVLYGWASRLIASHLYRVSALDVPTLAAAAALVGLSALGAAWQPAKRAGKTDPALSLRAE